MDSKKSVVIEETTFHGKKMNSMVARFLLCNTARMFLKCFFGALVILLLIPSFVLRVICGKRGFLRFIISNDTLNENGTEIKVRRRGVAITSLSGRVLLEYAKEVRYAEEIRYEED